MLLCYEIHLQSLLGLFDNYNNRNDILLEIYGKEGKAKGKGGKDGEKWKKGIDR